VDQFLSDLESSLNVPAALLERAAAARGAVTGVSAENVVRSWAGAGDAPAAAPPADPEPAAEPAPAEATAAPEPAPDAGVEVEVLEAVEPAPADEAAEESEEPVGVLAGFPGWLAAALLVFPVLALSYVLIAPNGPGCGASGQLAIDAETGLAENCDGSEYGVDEVSFFTIGQEIYTGSGRCAGCHGDDGGGGTGPAMSGGAVLVTFPGDSCTEHITWIQLGSDGWPDATYGANATPVGSSGAQMPGFIDSLTPEELAAVVIYERVAFGGQSLDDAEADCGVEELEVVAGG